MTGAVAPDTSATAPQERGWRWFVLALVAMVLVTAAPAWPTGLALIGGAIRLLLPVEQFALLVLVAIAACAVVGWWAGGRLFFAAAAALTAAWVVWQLPLPPDGYGAFVRGWTLATGAAFGLVCLAARNRPFLGRALATVALGGVVVLGGMASRSSAGVLTDATRMMGVEYDRRLDASLGRWQTRVTSPAWGRFARSMPDAARRASELTAVLSAMGHAGEEDGRNRGTLLRLVPALLALETLLALALGWATYHRLARVRIGPPLGALRDLRFNDQLVWGLVVGATLLLLPTLAEWRTAGANLVCFFGTLYALRGAGVLTWWIPDRLALPVLLGLLVLIPILGPILVLAALLLVTFGLGLGDTWRDFRAGAPPRRPTSLS